jgi:uncharacterized protein YbcI
MGERESEPLSGGELNAALSREMARAYVANLGRGPTKAFTFHHGMVVVTVMEEVMTQAERYLASSGETESVLAMRQRFQRALADELKASVEKLTLRRVVAFMSGEHVDPDLAVEVFVLDAPLS